MKTPFPSLVVLITLTIVACATPPRTLSTRVVEDPIVLPQRMAEASLSVDRKVYSPTRSPAWGTETGIRLGLTDRWEWTDLFSLTYAFLDDAPASRQSRRAFSLALRAGALGLGGSSTEGFIVLPLVSVTASKHIGDRWRIGTSVRWVARWASTSWSPPMPYDDALFWRGSRLAELSWSVGVTRQLSDHVALAMGGRLYQVHPCTDAWCDPVTRSASASLSLQVRPWFWLTISPFVSAGTRHRLLPVLADQNQPTDPTLPVVVPLMSVRWDAGANTTFNW